MNIINRKIIALSCITLINTVYANQPESSFLIDKVDSIENKISVIEKKLSDKSSTDDLVLSLTQKVANLEDQLQLLNGRVDKLQHSAYLHKERPQISNDSKKSDAELVGNSIIPPELQKYNQLINSKKYKKAIVGLEKFISKNKESSSSGVAYYLIAESYTKQNNNKQAAKYYLRSYKNYPDTDVAADSLLKLSKYVASTNKQSSACKLLDKLNLEYPHRSAANKEISEQIREKIECS